MTDLDDVALVHLDTSEVLHGWTQYTASESYGRATNSLSLTLADRDNVKKYYELLKPGSRVRLVIGDRPQATYYVDKRSKKGARDGGTTMSVTCRDSLAPLCDSCVDPLYIFNYKSTLNDVYKKVVTPFGIYQVISTTDIARRSVVTGNLAENTRQLKTPGINRTTSLDTNSANSASVQTQKVTAQVLSEYDPTRPVFLKNFEVNNLKPRSGEGCYEFLARLSKRFRLGLHADAMGEAIIVDAPDFNQPPLYQLRRDEYGANFLELEVEIDATELPSIIICTGIGGGYSFKAAPIKMAVVNELTGYEADGTIRREVQEIIDAHKGVRVLPPRTEIAPYRVLFDRAPVRPAFLHDEESRTPGQLEGFIRFEMASRQSKAIQLKARVKGHTQGGVPWTTNTLCSVRDNVLDINGLYWIRERTFSKSRSGQTTDLVMIPPYLFQF